MVISLIIKPYSEELIPKAYANILENVSRIAESYYYEGKVSDSVELLRKGDSIKEKEINSDYCHYKLNYIQRLIQQANLSSGDFDYPSKLLTDLHNQIQTINEDKLIAHYHNTAGNLLYWKTMFSGDLLLDEAKNHFQEALELGKKIDDPYLFSLSLFNLGLIEQHGGNYKESEDLFQESLKIALKNDYKWIESENVRHLGFIAEINGDLEKAIDYLEESLKIRQEMGLVLFIPSALTTIARVLQEKRDYKTAFDYLDKAYKLAKKMEENPRQISITIYRLGLNFKALGEKKIALIYFEEAKNIVDKIGFHYLGNALIEKIEALKIEKK